MIQNPVADEFQIEEKEREHIAGRNRFSRKRMRSDNGSQREEQRRIRTIPVARKV